MIRRVAETKFLAKTWFLAIKEKPSFLKKLGFLPLKRNRVFKKNSVAVYSQPNNFKTFGMDSTEVIDEMMDIHLPIQKIFRKDSNG